MKASRELDALIAEKVFGYGDDWIPKYVRALKIQQEQGSDKLISADFTVAMYDLMLPRYSTHIADAWLVVEKLEGQILIDRMLIGGWLVEIIGLGREPAYCADAATAPLAICLAALKAVKENCDGACN